MKIIENLSLFTILWDKGQPASRRVGENSFWKKERAGLIQTNETVFN